jgi:CubicO group peptidase (beta-lactamase class C family)
MRAIAFLLACMISCGVANAQAPVRAEDVGMSTARLERARAVLKTAVDERVAGSAVGLISRDGKVVFHEAFGERAPQAPMTRDAIARLASITKTVTAVAVLMLHEDGRLRLNDPVARFIPEFADVKVEAGDTGKALVAPARAITVHDLLTHQAGLAASGEAADALWSRARTVGEFAALTAAIPLRSQPGSEYEYGPAYEVLAAVVEKASGMSFARFVQQRILDPLRMHDTSFFVPRGKLPRMAGMYRKEADGRLSPPPPADPDEPTTFTSGGGGLVGTASDFHRFLQMLLNGGELDGQRLLGPKTVALLTTAHVDAARYGSASGDYGWGLGTRVRTRVTAGGPGSVGAFGWNGGSGTLYLVDPQERLVVIVFAPSMPRTPGIWGDADLRNDFVTAAYQAIVESRVRP